MVVRMKKHKKTRTYGPNDTLRRVVWARFRCQCHPDIFSCFQNIDKAKYIKKKHEKKKEKHVPMTQTTRLASFGPVFVVAAHLCLYIISQYMYNTKKKHTYGLNNAF